MKLSVASSAMIGYLMVFWVGVIDARSTITLTTTVANTDLDKTVTITSPCDCPIPSGFSSSSSHIKHTITITSSYNQYFSHKTTTTSILPSPTF